MTRVPGLKHVVGSSLKQKNRRELLIFLQPHIIESTEDLVEKNIHEVSKTIVAADAIAAARSEPEMDSSLFPMGDRKKLFDNGGDGASSFEEPPLPQHGSGGRREPVSPPRRGILKKFFDNGGAPAPQPAAKPKKRGLFGRRS